MLTSVDKMWAALLTGAIGAAAMRYPGITDHVGQEQIAAATTLLTTFTVWLVPNRK